MIKKPITINLSTGLEARPVAQLVQVASQFNSIQTWRISCYSCNSETSYRRRENPSKHLTSRLRSVKKEFAHE